MRLSFPRRGSVVLEGRTGYRASFDRRADGSFDSPAGVDYELARKDGEYKLTHTQTDDPITYTESDDVMRFSDDGKLTQRSTDIGGRIDYHYEGRRLRSITDNHGRKTTFAYDDGGYLERTKDANGKVITLPLVWTGLIVLGGIASAVIAWAPEHRQPTVLALTVLPIIGVVLASALSEALKHNVPSIGNAVFIAAAALAVPLTALLGAGVAAAWQAPRLRTALIAARRHNLRRANHPQRRLRAAATRRGSVAVRPHEWVVTVPGSAETSDRIRVPFRG